MNAKPPETVERFIQLCAEDRPLKRIAKELGVSRTTLVDWGRKYCHRISNLRTLETEDLADQNQISRRHCLKQLGGLLQRVNQELAHRKLEDLSTARLFAIAAELRAEAAKFNGPLHFSAAVPTDAPPEDQCPDPVVTWEI